MVAAAARYTRELHGLEIAEIERELDLLRAAGYAPLSTVTPLEFARTLRMPDEHGATKPLILHRYQEEPLAEIFNPRNQEVDLMMASRLGKSLIVKVGLGYVIVITPCRIGVMWPVEGDAKLWVKDDFQSELVEPNPAIAALFDDTRGQRRSSNTILNKRFPGGFLQVLGSNAPGRLRRMKARWLYADEIDAILGNLNDEGSILDIFAKRGSEFPDCVQVYCSYPSLRGRSAIEAKLLRSDLRLWFVPCSECGDPFILHRTGLDPWNDKQPRSKLIHADGPALARLQCPHCQALHDDAARIAMMEHGWWKPTRPYAGRVGFHAGSLLWPHAVSLDKFPGGFLQILAEKELAVETADNPAKTLRVLVNTDDAETFQAACDVKPEHTKLYNRREDYPAKVLPAGVLLITFGGDLQKDRAEIFIKGYGAKSQSWAIDYWIIPGNPLDPAFWEQIDKRLLQASWKHPSGDYLHVGGGLIDCGYLREKVIAWTRPRAGRKIYACYGSSQLARAYVGRPKREGKPPAKVYELGSNEGKDIIYQRLELDNPAAVGYMHYPAIAVFDEAHFRGLVIEDSEMRKAGDGDYYRAFDCPEGARNEPLDTTNYANAAERVIRGSRKEGVFYAKLATKYAVKGPREDPPPAPGAAPVAPAPPVNPVTPVKPPPRRFVQGARRPGGGKSFATGWR